MIEFVKTWVSKSENFANEQDGTLVEVISELLLEAANIDGKIDDKEIEESKHAICSFFDILSSISPTYDVGISFLDFKTSQLRWSNFIFDVENLNLCPLGSLTGVLDPARSSPAARPRHGVPGKLSLTNVAAARPRHGAIKKLLFTVPFWWSSAVRYQIQTPRFARETDIWREAD